MCSSSCPCPADLNETLWSADLHDDIATDSMGVKQLTECPSDGMTTDTRDKYLPMLTFLETEYGCAGLC